MRASSLLEIVTHYISVLILESLGFYVGTFVPTIFLQANSLSIWLGNSKLNGGPLSKFLQPKPFILLKTGSKHKSPNQRSPQSQNPRYLFGPNLYQAQFRGPKLLQKTHFLQIQPTGPISKTSKNMQLRYYPNLQTLTQKRKTLPPAQPSNTMKTCVTDFHTLPLSNGALTSSKAYFPESAQA